MSFSRLLWAGSALALHLLTACGPSVSSMSGAKIGQEAAVEVPSGDYGVLDLGFDGYRVTGIYEFFKGSKGGCVFYLYGDATQNPFPIKVYYPDVYDKAIKGTLEIKKDKTVVIRLEESPSPDCAPELTSPQGETLPLFREEDWKAVRIVRAEKVFFHTRPEEGALGSFYVLRYNPLHIYEEKYGWLRGDFENMEYYTEGWIPADDFYPVDFE